MMSLTKKRNSAPKIFFSLQTRRLAKSPFEDLNSSHTNGRRAMQLVRQPKTACFRLISQYDIYRTPAANVLTICHPQPFHFFPGTNFLPINKIPPLVSQVAPAWEPLLSNITFTTAFTFITSFMYLPEYWKNLIQNFMYHYQLCIYHPVEHSVLLSFFEIPTAVLFAKILWTKNKYFP